MTNSGKFDNHGFLDNVISFGNIKNGIVNNYGNIRNSNVFQNGNGVNGRGTGAILNNYGTFRNNHEFMSNGIINNYGTITGGYMDQNAR